MSRPRSWRGKRVYTIGHSTRTLDELVRMLRAFDIEILADIRTVPRSRRHPQFNRDTLPSALEAHGIRYAHIPELGGLRRARKDSPNTAWRNASFQGFADHMLTEEFEAGIDKLLSLVKEGRVAMMCAEAVPWRCHRSLVADALVPRGAHVEHITSETRSSPHRITPFAKIDGTRVTYPGDDSPDGGERLATRAPFHLEATVRVLQRRRASPVDRWEDGRYLRAFTTSEGLVLASVENLGTIDDPDVRVRLLQGDLSIGARTRLHETLRAMLGLDVDPKPLAKLLGAEPELRQLAPALRGMRPPRFPGLFETFASVIPFQQVSLDAGIAILRRIVERYGATIEHDGQRYRAFPTEGAIAEASIEALRECGLSLKKAEAIRHAARAIESGELDETELSKMESLDAIRFLSQLPGIGPWSATLILLRGLGRLDVFPPGDAGVARGLGRILREPPGPKLERMIDRFGAKRGYIYFVVLGGSLIAKGEIEPAPAR